MLGFGVIVVVLIIVSLVDMFCEMLTSVCVVSYCAF